MGRARSAATAAAPGGQHAHDRPADARPAGRPDDHACRRGRHVPRPLHGLGRAQRPAARDRARPRLVAVRARLHLRSTTTTQDGRHAFATEAEVYDFLGLPFIEPELREDRGEIEAALAGTLPTLGHARRSPGRLPHPLRLVGRPRTRSSAWPARRVDARPALPGPDRPHAEPDHRQRPDAASASSRSAGSSASSTRQLRAATAPTSGCCTAASWRSGRTAGSTTTTRCWRASTSSSRHSTSAGASRARS